MSVSLRRRLLVLLADEGTVEDLSGRVTSILAARLGCTPSRVGVLLAQLDAAGLVVRDHNQVSGRTFHTRLTETGRTEISREGHVHAAVTRRREPVSVAMPMPGSFSHVCFDPVAARERALGGVT